jgi:hypothetical protein
MDHIGTAMIVGDTVEEVDAALKKKKAIEVAVIAAARKRLSSSVR